MKIFFDTEFIEDGKTIDLISIGMIKEDGKEYYAISNEFNELKADQWVYEHVLTQLDSDKTKRLCRKQIAKEILKFVGPEPEFWGYFADYDWVVLCQLYGRMIDLPKGWPMYCRDLKQLCDQLGNTILPCQINEHNALDDAKWNKITYDYVLLNE